MMRRRVPLALFVSGFLFGSILFGSVNVVGTDGSFDFTGISFKYVFLYQLKKGDVVDYSWSTDDISKNLTFSITGNDGSIKNVSGVAYDSGSFKVPSDGDYLLSWWNFQYGVTTSVTYHYTIKEPSDGSSAGVNTTMLIGLLTTIIIVVVIVVAVVKKGKSKAAKSPGQPAQTYQPMQAAPIPPQQAYQPMSPQQPYTPPSQQPVTQQYQQYPQYQYPPAPPSQYPPQQLPQYAPQQALQYPAQQPPQYPPQK